MHIGSQRHKIIIQQPTYDRDAGGGVSISWFEFATIRASIEPVAGNEKWSTDQSHPEITHIVRFRYLPGVKPVFRVLFGTRIFDIVDVVNFQERNVEIICRCIEQVL